MVEMVFPDQTSHYGSLYGGNTMAAMGKAAFVAASRRCRKAVVMAATRRADFTSRIYQGEVMELAARVDNIRRTSMTIGIDLWAENLLSGERRDCGRGEFVMVAVDSAHRPTAFAGNTAPAQEKAPET